MKVGKTIPTKASRHPEPEQIKCLAQRLHALQWHDINELKWIIELKNIKDKKYICIKYERNIWILFWEEPLFFPQINMSFGRSSNEFLNAAVFCSVRGRDVGPTQNKVRTPLLGPPRVYFWKPSFSSFVSLQTLSLASFLLHLLLTFNSSGQLLISSFSLLLPSFCLFHHWLLIGQLPSFYFPSLRAYSTSQAELAIALNILSNRIYIFLLVCCYC